MTLLRVGRIHGHPDADSIEITAGRIARIGKNLDSEDGLVDRGDSVVLPGLRDSHIHPVGLAVNADRLDVSTVANIDELVDRLRERAAHRPGAVVAVGFDDERVTEGRMPSATDLDRVSAEHPVVVYRHCSHVAAANHVALQQAGIDSDTPDPDGGRIRRGTNGRLTGVLEETALVPLAGSIDQTLDPPDRSSVYAQLSELRRLGLVAIDAMAATGESMWCSGGDELGVIASLGTDSPVMIDVFVICTDPHELREAATRLAAAGPRVRFAGWKAFADGSLGARTAAMRSPYDDDPATSGLLVAKNLESMAETAVELGGQAAIHAIGDLAVDRASGLAERLGVAGAVRVEHASIADPDQIARMAAAGVVASVQPSFFPADAPWLARRLGVSRAAWAYPFASLLGAGVTLRGGSDAPIESADPLVGIRDACVERPERLTVVQAIDMYTAAPIEVGGLATFVVCNGEPNDPAARVVEVWQNGAPM